jgi:hypothetical protein
MAFDDEFKKWLRELPDLDARDRQAAEAALIATHGAASVARARRLCRIISAASVLLTAWAIVFSRPQAALAIAAIAVELVSSGILLYGRGLYAAGLRRKDPRPSPVFGLILPALVLAGHAYFTFLPNLLDGPATAIPACVAGAAVGALVALADPGIRRRPRDGLFSMMIVGGLFTGGAAIEINCVFDQPIQTYETSVTKKMGAASSASSHLVHCCVGVERSYRPKFRAG